MDLPGEAEDSQVSICDIPSLEPRSDGKYSRVLAPHIQSGSLDRGELSLNLSDLFLSTVMSRFCSSLTTSWL